MIKNTAELHAIEDLVTRVDAAVPVDGGRLVAFVASGDGEGTTTIAEAFATANAKMLGRRVLLLSASAPAKDRADVLQALADGDDLDAALTVRTAGGHTGRLGGMMDLEPAWDLLGRRDLWQRLRDRFDLIVLDLPSAATSRAVLKLAPLCDGVVVVVEAEKSRAPVVESLVNDLRAVQAHVVGTVLNKRRFYLPERLYRWL